MGKKNTKTAYNKMTVNEAIECLEDFVRTVDNREGDRSSYDLFVKKEHYAAIQTLKEMMDLIDGIKIRNESCCQNN